MSLRITLFMLTGVLLLVACGGNVAEPAAETGPTNEPAIAMVEEPAADVGVEHEEMANDSDQMGDDAEMMDEPTALEDAGESLVTDEPADNSSLPAWQQATLTDVRTGESFTLADFAGKTVFVEPMATWCTNCRQQLGNVQQARAQLADDNVVFVALSVETNLTEAQLAEYTLATGFDWVFAVMTPEMLQSMADQFGRTIANPPATPHFIIRPDGSATELVTGIEPVEAIITQIRAAQG